MSTPQQSTKAPRRSTRKPKQSSTPNGPHSRGTVSDNELSQAQIQNESLHVNGDLPHSRRKSHAATKRNNEGPHRGSVSDTTRPEKPKATPVKQAYAGPTFHQSPAASALPLPSFYSRSVPNASAPQIPPQSIPEQREEEQQDELSKNETPSKRESTPLDFLFEAARQARSTPRGQSPSNRSGHLSVRNGSPASKSPAPKDPDSMFPFELDGSSTPGEDGSSFATPYKDRMEALRSGRPASAGGQNMDETERKAKTDALKRLLMRSTAAEDMNDTHLSNPFNARPAQSSNQLPVPQPQFRHRSGPSTPSYMQSYAGSGRSDQYLPHLPRFQNNEPGHHASHRLTSNLRNVYGASSEPEPAELSSDSAISPPRISTAREPVYSAIPPSTFHGQISTAPKSNQLSDHKATPSVQQMEDDLRRVLKLDLTSRGYIDDVR